MCIKSKVCYVNKADKGIINFNGMLCNNNITLYNMSK